MHTPQHQQTRSHLTSLVAAFWFVCALLLQPLAMANVTADCDTSGECCCTAEVAPQTSCCEVPQSEPRQEPEFVPDSCDCEMSDEVPAEPWPCTPPPEEVQRPFEHVLAVASDALPLTLAGGFAVAPEVVPPDRRNERPGLSLLIRRLQASGMSAHLARLGELRL